MNSFSELLGQLSPDEYERGKQFEKICKWFLETDRRYSNQISNVWLWDDWPGRWGPDSGIDLIAEDREGKIWAIQAKCYDEDYSVTKTDIDKFLSESTHELIDHRILIATTDKIAKRARTVMNNQNKVISVNQILRHDLETAPLVWPSDPTMLLGGGYADPKEPRPHQEEAIRNITDNLSDRGQFISACGTGKTLTSLWVTEKLNSRLTLVLVPSLTLLSQTISDWLSNSNEQFNYLPVCSDATVKADDAAVMFTAELPYPPTTKPEEIAAFANAKPTCLAAHTKIILFPSDNPNGDNVFPVPVGAIYKTNFGLGCLQRINNCFWWSYNVSSAYFNKYVFFSIKVNADETILIISASSFKLDNNVFTVFLK